MIGPEVQAEDTSTQHPDIETFLAQNSVKGDYKCIIYKWSDELSSWSMMKAYSKRTPEATNVVTEFGTGIFKWVWTTEEKDEMTGKPKPAVEFKQAFSGEHWEDLHEDYRLQKEEEREKKIRARYSRTSMQRQYFGGNEKQDPADELKRIIEIARMLQPPAPPQQDQTLLVELIRSMRPTGPSTVETLLLEMIRGKTQVEVAHAAGSNKDNPENTALKMLEFFEKGAQMKRESDAPAPSTFSEIMEVVKEVAPKVIEFLGKVPPSTRGIVADAALSTMPNAKKFKGQINAMKGNPEWVEKAVNEWDKTYGPAQVDMFLQAGGITRPESTMQNYEKFAEKKEETPAPQNTPTEETVPA